MIVDIQHDGGVSLEDPAVFTAFSVRNAASRDAGDVLAAVGAGGAIPGETEVNVSIEWIRSEIITAGVENGEEQLEGMLSYARTKGWVDDDGGFIRSHVE